jgi:leucyl aminopeptidase
MQRRSPKIVVQSAQLSHKSAEIYTDLILLVPSDFAQSQYGLLPHGDVLRDRMLRHGYRLGDSKPFTTLLPNRTGTRVSLAAVGTGIDGYTRLGLARKLAGFHREPVPERLGIACYGGSPLLTEATVAAVLAAESAMPDYRSRPETRGTLKHIDVYGARTEYTRTLAEAQGNNLARFLTALPPNELTPKRYRQRAERLAREHGWDTEFLDLQRLKRRKAGAFIAVAQGSPEPDAGILRLRYHPKRRTRAAPLALVGKGICYDTGGTNLKTAKGMFGMHEDMEGSAVALGTLLALSLLEVDFPVEAWLALAQNHIGPRAYRPNEVVQAANGTTIEIVHTDAEGRMVLADTLVLAGAAQPRLVIDYATLTGACVQALSTRMSGAFTNRDEFISTIIAAGRASGERVWPFPLPDDYREDLKSDIADIKQCTLGNEADHILAALFLQKFVADDTPWIHLDLSAGNHKGGLAHVPSDITGFGVRFTLNLLFDQGLDRLLSDKKK